jgi:hypothetical protein
VILETVLNKQLIYKASIGANYDWPSTREPKCNRFQSEWFQGPSPQRVDFLYGDSESGTACMPRAKRLRSHPGPIIAAVLTLPGFGTFHAITEYRDWQINAALRR